MIEKELFKVRNVGVKLYRTYSSEGFKIKQLETDVIYDEAIDIQDSNYTYIETDERIGGE